MDLACGGDLLERVMNDGPFSNVKALRVFDQVTRALNYCHQFNISHRDLKCENILLDALGNAKLTDFSFARNVLDPQTQKKTLSRTYCGSAAYAAPEILGGTPYNPMLADVWSLGVVLFITVTSVMPFDDSDRSKMLKCQRSSKWKIPSRFEGAINSCCRLLLARLLEPDVTKRATLRQVMDSQWLKQYSAIINKNISTIDQS